MTTFSLQNFGCRATEADAATLRRSLRSEGLSQVEEQTSADIVVLNTCTVTAAADAQAREAIRKIHRQNPSARIVVTGCYAQRAPEELAGLPGVALVAGNSHFSQLPSVIGRLDRPSHPCAADARFIPLSRLEDQMSLENGPAKILTGDIFAESVVLPSPTAAGPFDRTRPILKIQDGCNNRCSYCVIPFVRGRSRSLPPPAVLEQVRALAISGVKEIVLSGINLGSYGRDRTPRTDLFALVRQILADTDLERLRFSSIEPQDVTDDFIRLVASSDRIAQHFHVPMQSGSDRILKAMHRWYRAEHYAQRIELIRSALPHAAIGADVMAGFPGETEDDFAATMGVIEKLPFTYLHAFSFSARPGTAAASLDKTVPVEKVRERARKLRRLGEEKNAAFRRTEARRIERALTLDRRSEGWTECLTGNYLRVRIAGQHRANQWVKVRVRENPGEIAGEIRLGSGRPQDVSPAGDSAETGYVPAGP
jgi:threonylcarbamoyladenosine tRNA methylthiotransferase MtaB